MSRAWSHTAAGAAGDWTVRNNSAPARVVLLLHWERLPTGSLRLRLPNGGCVVKHDGGGLSHH